MKPVFRSAMLIALISFIIFYSCKKERSCEGCVEGSKSPVAVAGPDQLLNLPIDSILLDGSASSDPDGTISKWLWRKISGPASFTILQSSNSVTKVGRLARGVYLFELQVTDDDALSAKDTIQITVYDPGQINRLPVANAGDDQSITLPSNVGNLDGSASSDPDNDIVNYSWTKISGPASFTLVSPGLVQTTVTNLMQGIYRFELKVTDAQGLSAKDTTQITVLTSTNVPNGSDVYIAGWGINSKSIARVWNNNAIQDLSNGQIDARAYAVAVFGSDVYVSGYSDDGFDATLWKNGNAQVLMDGGYTECGATGADAKSISVSGNDVYVAGAIWEGCHLGGSVEAVLWKNGVKQTLGAGWASSVFASGNDVYAAGFLFGTGPGTSSSVLWKNGIVQYLGQGEANSVFVSGSDVYVAGDDDPNNIGGSSTAILWKNGIAQNLGAGTANSVFVSNSDVYVAGVLNGASTLWKNGVSQNLGSGSANSVFVSGSDVYVAGKKVGVATLWKNGVAYTLHGLSEARQVVVK